MLYQKHSEAVMLTLNICLVAVGWSHSSLQCLFVFLACDSNLGLQHENMHYQNFWSFDSNFQQVNIEWLLFDLTTVWLQCLYVFQKQSYIDSKWSLQHQNVLFQTLKVKS